MIGQRTRFISGTTFSANSGGKVQPLSLIEIKELVHLLANVLTKNALHSNLHILKN
jgi:hypothetical protein